MADIARKLIDQVELAIDERQPIVVRGGGTKSFMGRAVPEDALVIGLSKHTGIVSYEPVELVMTARAGTRLEELELALEENNQMLAFEPPYFGSGSTIGGTLATNQSGPSRPWWGSVRDHLLGVRLINGRAEHLRFGGQVMKNVAGYDLSRLQAGAMGGLGLITELSFKVLPKPASTITLAFDCDQAEGILLMNKRAGESKPLSAAAWFNNRVYFRLSGAASAVDATAKTWGGEVVEDAQAFWRKLRDQQVEFFNTEEPVWRFSMKSTATPFDIDAPVLLDWGGASRWYSGQQDIKKMVAIAEAAGGQVSLFRGGDRQGEVNHPIPMPLQGLQKRVKASLDPKGLLNPGRVYGWL